MEISLVLYVYPGIEKYFSDLICSINNQSIKEFDVIIFNDNVDNLNMLFKDLEIHYLIFNITGSINQIRFKSLNVIRNLKSEYIIFQDADDLMSENRIVENLKALRHYDLVVNDITLVNENSEVLEDSYWSKRLGDNFKFDENFIKDKNIVGLGNTSIKKTLLIDPRLNFSALPLAFDWFLFYQIFKFNNLNAIFISTTTTYYRQHQSNIAGLKTLDFSRLKHVLNVKNAHYNALLSIGFDFKKELYQLNKIQIDLIDFLKFNSDVENYNLFWWEETNNLINKI